MYQDFYQLKEAPFNVTPDPRYLFFSTQHREAFDLLRFGIEQRKGSSSSPARSGPARLR